MSYSIDDYLTELKMELKGSDKAIIQDALADAHEHLTTALEEALQADSEQDPDLALSQIVERYGTPAETSAAYREVEARTASGFSSDRPAKNGKGVLSSFFGVYNDPRAWGGMVYMLIGLLLGVLYFDWALVALSITLVFILVLSIFFRSAATFYFLSIEALALMEGRIVEALLHIRMPRRPLLHPKDLPWKERFKYQISDKATWRKLAYMFVMMPLGTAYFCAAVIMIAFSISGLLAPVLQEVLHQPIITFGIQEVFLPGWSYPLSILAGILLFTFTLHFTNGIGRLHGKFAKYMLVE
jgi:hypothetical protein